MYRVRASGVEEKGEGCCSEENGTERPFDVGLAAIHGTSGITGRL